MKKLLIGLLALVACNVTRTTIPVVEKDYILPDSNMISARKTIKLQHTDAQLEQKLSESMRGKPTKPVDTTKPAPTPTPIPTPLPSGTKLVYFNWNGKAVKNQYWNSGQLLTCAPSTMTREQKDAAIKAFLDVYFYWKIAITEDESVFLAAPIGSKQEVIITPTSGWYTGVSGVAQTGSMINNMNAPAFVFEDRLYKTPIYIGRIAAHEVGHTITLRHQAEYDTTNGCILVNSYRMGWNMGNNLNASSPIWGVGTGPNCIKQNDSTALDLYLGRK